MRTFPIPRRSRRALLIAAALAGALALMMPASSIRVALGGASAHADA